MKRDNFFIKFKNSLYKLDAFPRYIEDGLGRAIFYAFILSLILGIITGIGGTFRLSPILNQGIDALKTNKNTISIENNTLSFTGGPVLNNIDGVNIYINDKYDTTSSEVDSMVNYPYIAMLKNGVVIAGANDVKTDMLYSKFGVNGINNNMAISFLNQSKITSGVIFSIKDTIYRFMDYIMSSILITVIATIISAVLKMIVRPKAVFIMILYAGTLASIVILPLNLAYPSVLTMIPFVIATTIYIGFILKHIKDSLVKERDNKKGKEFL